MADTTAVADTDRQWMLAVWRARFAAVGLTAAAFALTLALLATGLARIYYVSALPMGAPGDQMWSFLDQVRRETGVLHRYGGFLLMFLLGAAALWMTRLGTLLAPQHRYGAMLRIIGVTSLLVGIGASVIAIHTGYATGHVLDQALLESDNLAALPADAPLPIVKAMEHTTTWHAALAAPGLGLTVVLLSIGVLITGTPTVRRAAGIGGDKKRDDPGKGTATA